MIISKSCANQEDKDSIKIVEINKGIAGGKKFKEKNIFLKVSWQDRRSNYINSRFAKVCLGCANLQD